MHAFKSAFMPSQDVDMMVHYGEGTLLPPNDTASGGGCVLLPDVLPSGDPLVSPEDNLQPSLEECCRSCRELERCNVFWYCREQVRRMNQVCNYCWYYPSSRSTTAWLPVAAAVPRPLASCLFQCACVCSQL